MSNPRKGVNNTALDLDTRLLRIEKQLETGSPSAVVSAGGAPAPGSSAAPSGLRLLNNVPGAITIKWSLAAQSTVDRFEIEIASDRFFLQDKQTRVVSGRTDQFIFTEGNPGDTYYAHIRSVTSGGKPSLWSATLNTTTGQATSNHILSGANGNVVINRQVPTEDINIVETTDGNEVSRSYIETPVQVSGTGALIVVGNAKYDYQTSLGTEYSVDLYQGETRLKRYEARMNLVASSGRFTIPFADLFPTPSAGLYTFHVVVSVSNYDTTVASATYGSPIPPPGTTRAFVRLLDIEIKIAQLAKVTVGGA